MDDFETISLASSFGVDIYPGILNKKEKVWGRVLDEKDFVEYVLYPFIGFLISSLLSISS